MKLVIILGDYAVGKMTVGQELTKITALKLFHAHMAIEPVLGLFGHGEGTLVYDIRDLIFKQFAASNQYGMIFTRLMDFDDPADWEYLNHIQSIFAPFNSQIYYIELIAPQEIRLKRNGTPNRLRHKASKRDINQSNFRLIDEDEHHRFISRPGEITFNNYLRIDNSNKSAELVAQLIKETFSL